MKRTYLSVLLAAVAALALGLVSVGSASAATMKEAGGFPFLAVYGFPGANSFNEAGVETSKETPIGGGLGRSFGFGENMLFQAGNGVGTNLAITLGPKATTEEAQESFIGGTLTSNKTGVNNPLGFAVQFVDIQAGSLPGYSDTYDRPWLSTICAPGAEECRVDSLLKVKKAGEQAEGRNIKIEDVSIDLANAKGGATVVQGTVWGKWENGKEKEGKKEAPCITLENPPAAAGTDQTLIVTQSSLVTAAEIAVGTKVTTVKGKACLISANNNWYKVSPAKEPIIEIANE